jgi:peroxiredoxin
MTIKVGDKLPEAKFRVMTAEGLQVKTTDDIFKGKKVALFAVPGAYTGTCHKMHLPSIFLNAYAIKNKGVDTIAIVSVNDAFVMNAWKRDTDQRDEATFLADGNAEFTRAIGMELDASGNGLGIRSKRYSSSTSSPPRARSRSPAGTRCSGSFELTHWRAELGYPLPLWERVAGMSASEMRAG